MLGAGVGVAPRVARRAVGRRVVPGGLLPLRLRGQPAPGPAGVRVRLVPAHVHDGFVGRHHLGDPEPAPQPLRAVPEPELRCVQGVLADVRPAVRRPPARVVVAAGRDERLVGGVRHRRRVDEEGRHLAPVRGPFVVQGPRLGGGAHRERATGDQDFGRTGERGSGLGVGRVQNRRPLPQLMGDQHRLVMLLFVLGDHPEGEPRLGQARTRTFEGGALQHVQGPAAHLRRVLTGLGGRQQRQRGPFRARVLEGVVQAVDLGPHRLPPGDRTQQPHLLLVADMGQVPHQRGHQRRVLGREFGIVHGGEERGPLPRGGERGERALPERLRIQGGVGHVLRSFPYEVPCASRSVPRSWSSRSSAGQRPWRT